MAIRSQDWNCESRQNARPEKGSGSSPFVVEWNDDHHSLTITRPKNCTGEADRVVETMGKRRTRKLMEESAQGREGMMVASHGNQTLATRTNRRLGAP